MTNQQEQRQLNLQQQQISFWPFGDKEVLSMNTIRDGELYWTIEPDMGLVVIGDTIAKPEVVRPWKGIAKTMVIPPMGNCRVILAVDEKGKPYHFHKGNAAPIRPSNVFFSLDQAKRTYIRHQLDKVSKLLSDIKSVKEMKQCIH